MPKGKVVTDEEIEAVEELYEQGVGPTEIAKTIDRPVETVKNVIKKEGLAKSDGKGKVPKVLTKEAKDSIIVSTAKEIANDAKETHEEIIRIGKYIYGNCLERARSRGITLEEYIEQTVVFHTNYSGLIEEMEEKIKKQRDIIDKLTKFLNPVPYRMAIIEEMVKQEGRKDGRIYSDQDIEKYLNAVNLVLEIGGGEDDGSG